MFEVRETNLQFAHELSSREKTTLIVIHHVGDIDRDVSADEIHQCHLNNGWAGIGYHYVIRKDGTVERGRPRDTIGSHALNYNSSSIGINVVGDFEAFQPEPIQIEQLACLLAQLCDIYMLEPVEDTIVGHRDLMETDCPGKNLYDILTTVRGKAVWYQQHGIDGR